MSEPMENRPAMLRLRVHRRKQSQGRAHFDNFDVAAVPGRTLLDALIEVRRRIDPSLAIRHSCMHASCGTCGMRVDGDEVLACDTKLETLAADQNVKATTGRGRDRVPVVTVEPIANQRLVADLAVDMAEFYARFEPVGMPPVRKVEPNLPGQPEQTPEPPDGIRAYTRFENCIECGLCVSACPVMAMKPAYLGPAALAAAARVDEEPRGCDVDAVRALASEPDSVWSCRDIMRCSAVCPSAVEPALALISLRRHVATDWRGILRRRRRSGDPRPDRPDRGGAR